MKTSTWSGCYDENLKGLITPESFAHPAKMAKKLCERIFDYGAEQGYWQPGDVIVDPFGGIGTTGLIGAYRGYQVISVELEPRFVEMHKANISRNAAKLRRLGKPLPIILQGDARRLSEIVRGVVGAISSPPYADGSAHTGCDDPHPEKMTGGKFVGVGLNGAISSPPYADSVNGGEGPGARYDFVTHSPENAVKQTSDSEYGVTAGQIGALREGDFENVVGAVTSPPYAASINQSDGANDSKARLERKAHAGVDISRAVNRGGPNSVLNQEQVYGITAGQIGAESGETYWQAMAQVYAELYKVLRTGGVAAIVVKDFVRNKERMPLCDRTADLLEAIGFSVIERTLAMLVKENSGPAMFAGHDTSAKTTKLNGEAHEMSGEVMTGTLTKRTERKSFFRRLAEKNGAPRIDYEEVIWAMKEKSGHQTLLEQWHERL